MGDSYKLAIDGSTTGNLYGLAWSHPNAGGVAGNLNTHGLLVMENGTFLAAISGSIRARDDMRAPIFYDSNDTGYYLDPNSTSNLYKFSGGTLSRNNLNRMHTNSPWDTRANQSAAYQNGTMGWGTYSFNSMTNWGSGFTDTWSNPGNAPGGSSHYVGLQSMHHSSENSYNFYGFQMTCAGEADNRFFWRSSWNTPRSWVEMIHSGNIGSQSVNYASSAGNADTVDGEHASNFATHRGEGRNYVEYSRYVYNNGAYSGSGWIEPSDLGVRYAASSNYSNSTGSLSGFDKNNPSFGAVYSDNWFRVYNDTGLYSQSYGGHIRRSLGSSFGNWETFGYERNGWSGFCYVHNYLLNIMSNTSGDHGFYQENGNGWTLFYNRGNNCWGIGTDNTYSGDGFRCVKYGSSQYGWTTWSDRRAKENITSITGALDKVLNMRGVYFNYISDDAKTQRVGFIAQELEQVLPEAVRYAEEIDEYNVEYAQIVSVLTEAIKEQDAKITRLEALVEQLINN
jgi:hypothetical protein